MPVAGYVCIGNINYKIVYDRKQYNELVNTGKSMFNVRKSGHQPYISTASGNGVKENNA